MPTPLPAAFASAPSLRMLSTPSRQPISTVVAAEWRSTLVTASRTTQAAGSCQRIGRSSTSTSVLDAGGRQQGAGTVQLLLEVAHPIAARQLPGLAERSWAVARTSSIMSGAVGSPRRARRRGELGAHRDRGQVPPEHVVHVAGEPQPLLGDRQRGLRVAGPVQAPYDVEHPQRQVDGEPDEQRGCRRCRGWRPRPGSRCRRRRSARRGVRRGAGGRAARPASRRFPPRRSPARPCADPQAGWRPRRHRPQLTAHMASTGRVGVGCSCGPGVGHGPLGPGADGEHGDGDGHDGSHRTGVDLGDVGRRRSRRKRTVSHSRATQRLPGVEVHPFDGRTAQAGERSCCRA